ncbi:MAG TPA: helix-turn-helix domain-containing protein [Polyangia bacterium]|nr:helix-turn-helix domain-containing protein [Polyangia bacterium]
MAPTREQQRLRTRKRLLREALAVFRRDGVAGARIDDIARAAGVSRGTFYFHFPTKDDVLLARIQHTEEKMARAVEALPARASPSAVLEVIGRAMAAELEPDPALLPDVAAAALRRTALAPQDRDSSTLRASLAARFRAAAVRGQLHLTLPGEILADIYLGLALGGLLAWRGHRSTSLRSVLDGVARLFLHGAQK